MSAPILPGPVAMPNTETHHHGYTYDRPPGSEMVDPNGKEEHVHYPMPTKNPADPLNWTRPWKMITYATVLVYIFCITLSSIATSTMYKVFLPQYGLTVEEVSSFISWSGLMLGLAGLFWVPFGNAFGRRPVWIISTLGTLASVLWFPFATSYGELLAARLLYGLFGSPIECFAPIAIADIFFTSERSVMHAWFFISLAASTQLGPALSGAFVDMSETGWKAFFYLSTGLLALTFAVIVPYLPETRFSRSLALSSGQGTENISTILEQDDKNTFELNTENINDVARVEAATVSLVGTGGPSKAQRWGVTAGRDPHYRVMDALIKVWLTATLGPVWLPVGWFAACKGILVGQSFIAAQIWQAAPYNFSNAAVGCTYIPAILGAIASSLFWGHLSDWDLARRTRANKGMRVPEMRLYLIIPSAIIGIIGAAIYGYGAEKAWHWAVVLIVGVGVNVFGLYGPMICALSYSIDTYKHLAPEIGLLMSLGGNLWVFAMGYFANQLLAEHGAGASFQVLMVPVYVMLVITVVYIYVGKSARRLTINHRLLRDSRFASEY